VSAPAQTRTASSAPAATAQGEPKYGGILLLANRGDPPGAFDTMRTTTISLSHVTGSIGGNGNLVRPCRGDIYKLCGFLAEKWENNPDFTQWTFRIRDDIKWHDGKPFTAEDAKYWVELSAYGAKSADGTKSRTPSVYAADFGDLTRVEVLEGNRLRVTLKRGSPQYLFGLADARINNLHPPHLLKPRIDRGDVSATPLDVGVVSIGPYKFEKFERGVRTQVRRNDFYWEKDEKGRKLPYLDGIDFVSMGDPAAMDAAFRVGRLDGGARGFGHTLTPERQAGYSRDLGDKVWFAEIAATRAHLAFNMLKPSPVQDVRVRKAIGLWFDKRDAVKAVLGYGYVFTILGPQNPFISPDFLTWPGFNEASREKDKAEAKRILAEAGYAPGQIQLTHLCRRLWIPRCEFYQSQLAGLGINLKIPVVDDAGWNLGRPTLDYETQDGGTVSFAVIPEALEGPLTIYSRNKLAEAKHEDPKVLAFFNRMQATVSYDERVKIYRELERYYLLEQVYGVPSFGDMSVMPYRSYVKGIILSQENNQNDTDFPTVWLDK
jgi:peptide/nickel transport system substrate-binding protein